MDPSPIRESDAILLYLVERYDKEHKFSVTEANEKFALLQWLFFQASGQGLALPFRSRRTLD